MVNYKVLSIHPTTKSPELMPTETLEQTQAHRRRALADGRLLVEIVQSPAEHEERREGARALVASLP